MFKRSGKLLQYLPLVVVVGMSTVTEGQGDETQQEEKQAESAWE